MYPVIAGNIYAKARLAETERTVRNRNGGEFPKIPQRVQDQIFDLEKRLWLAEDAFRRYGFREDEIQTIKGKLSKIATKYGMTTAELRTLTRAALDD